MDIQEEVIHLVAEHLNIKTEEISPESEFVRDLKADSLDTVEMVMALEEKFNLQIPDKEAEKMSSVQSVINYIKDRKS